jgi:PAS domain S-box-containing protein
MSKKMELERQVHAAQDRLQQLQQQAGGSGLQNPLLTEAIAELSIALEELEVASEELYQQNEELLNTRQSLEAERQRYQNLFDFAPDAYLVTDRQGIIESINGAAESLFNVRRDYAQNKSLTLLIAKSHHPFIYSQLDRIAQSIEHPGQAQAQSPRSRKHHFSPNSATIVLQDQEVSAKPRQQATFPVSLSLSVEYDRQGEIAHLYWLVRDLRERKQAEFTLQQQLLRERLMADIARDIRKSLDLNAVLSRTVARVRSLLNCDRVLIYRFYPDWSGTIVVESVGEDYPSALQTNVEDQYFMETHGEDYRQGRIQVVANIHTADLTPCHIEMLTQFQIKANLVVPILQGERLWGLLVANQCSAPRTWQPTEIELLKQIATQAGIAIQQAELYQTLQTELSDRKQTERSLRETKQQLQAVLDNSPAVIYVIDPQNKHLLVNRCYAEILSTTPEILMHKSIYEIWPTEIADTFAANNQRVLQGNQLLETEEVALLPDGLHTYITLKFPLCDDEGNSYAVCGISTDITDRKLAEQRIREQAALLDIASDAIFVRDLEHHILYWNQGAERLYGWSAAEAIGQKADELLQIDPAQVVDIMQTLLTWGEWRGEIRKVTKTGIEVIAEARWTLVRDEAGQPTSILAVDTDITQKKQLEAQFHQAQRLESIGTLASGIAHDLNNILTPILAMAQVLRFQKPTLNPSTLEKVRVIEESAKRGANMVKQILAFTRNEEEERIPLAVTPLLRETIQIMQQTFPKSIEIRENISKQSLAQIASDPTHLHQILMNLCVNARDAMPQGGVLTISAENFYVDTMFAQMILDAQVGNYLCITVADTGTGIPTEVRDRIFDPFFTTKVHGQGTGLGLTTVLGTVKNYGGFVQVLSEPGEGTQFKVYLPILEGTLPDETEPLSELPQGEGELVLIVEDDPAIQLANQTLLESYHYRTLVAKDGIEAIALYATHQEAIQIVLMDIMMPNLDGIATVRAMKYMNPQVSIIAMSGVSTHKEAVLAAGAQAFLAKPYSFEDLLQNLSFNR